MMALRSGYSDLIEQTLWPWAKEMAKTSTRAPALDQDQKHDPWNGQD